MIPLQKRRPQVPRRNRRSLDMSVGPRRGIHRETTVDEGGASKFGRLKSDKTGNYPEQTSLGRFVRIPQLLIPVYLCVSPPPPHLPANFNE